MENPDTYRVGKDLVEFEWRQNHRNFYSCFSLKFYREKDMPLLTGRFPDQSGDEMRESETDAFSNPIPWQLTWVQWFELQNMLAESICPRTESRLQMSRTKPTAKSGSFGAPMTGTRFKSSAVAMQKRWRPWCCVLPKKLMPRQTLKRSNARYAKRQSYILCRMWGQTPCKRIKTNHTIYCNRRIYHERT